MKSDEKRKYKGTFSGMMIRSVVEGAPIPTVSITASMITDAIV